jgi:hypothetical protein
MKERVRAVDPKRDEKRGGQDHRKRSHQAMQEAETRHCDGDLIETG